MLITEMGNPFNNTHALAIGCPNHSWGAFLPEYFAEMEESYRRTGKPVVRVIELNR